MTQETLLPNILLAANGFGSCALGDLTAREASAGDGIKYGRLLLKGMPGSATPVGVDFSITIDTAGPIMASELKAA